jgi:hypothetical protein
MFKANLLDIDRLKFLAANINSISDQENYTISLPNFLFSMGQFARLNHIRCFDSSDAAGAMKDSLDDEIKKVFETILESDFIANAFSKIDKFGMDSYNQVMSGLFGLNIGSFDVKPLDKFIDFYLQKLSSVSFEDREAQQAMPMCCYVVSNIYNKMYTESELPESIKKFSEMVKRMLIDDPLSLTAVNRAQMHGLMVTILEKPDPTYAQFLREDLVQVLKTIPIYRLVYVQRLISLMSPDLLDETVSDTLVKLGDSKINARDESRKVTLLPEEIEERRAIESLYNYWLLAELDSIEKCDQDFLQQSVLKAIEISRKYPSNENIRQSLVYLVTQIQVKNIA